MEVVNEINQARTNPKEFAQKILAKIPMFKGKGMHLPNSNVVIMSKEGAPAFTEAALFLNDMNPVPALKPSKGLMAIAQDYLEQIQNTSPQDINNIDVQLLIDKYGYFNGNFSRQTQFGGSSPEFAIINLIVCDGKPTRDQRTSLFSTDVKLIGCAFGTHQTYGNCTVILTATEFTNNDNSNDNYLQGNNVVFTSEVGAVPQNLGNVSLKSKPGSFPSNENNDDDDDFYLPPGVKSIKKNEKIIEENGKKKKVTKIIKYNEDGSKDTELIKEDI